MVNDFDDDSNDDAIRNVPMDAKHMHRERFMKETRASNTHTHTRTYTSIKYTKRKFDKSNVDKC